jgi:hypothetical protein
MNFAAAQGDVFKGLGKTYFLSKDAVRSSELIAK